MGAVSLGRVVDMNHLPILAPQRSSLPAAAVAQGSNEHTPSEILKTALDALGGIHQFVKPGQVVAIKPNATWAFPPHTASSTDPEMLRALIHLVQEAGASRVLVMDHCSIEPGTVKCLLANQIGRIVEETGVEGIFPDRYLAPKETYTTIDLPEGRAFNRIGVIKTAVEADVRINLGVAKSHSVTRMTLALKHMMGFLEAPGSLHSNLHKGIADLNTHSPIRADLHILEALRVRMAYGDYVTCAGPETDESHPFMIKRMNQIIAGTDPVLVDAYACSTFYDVKPAEFAHLKNAFDWGIGDLDVEAAKISGKLLLINVGDTAALPASLPPEPEESKQAAIITSEKGTKPLPIPLPESNLVTDIVIPASSFQTNCNNVVSPNGLLNTALIPASAVLVGAGLIASRKKQSKKSPVSSSTDEKD